MANISKVEEMLESMLRKVRTQYAMEKMIGSSEQERLTEIYQLLAQGARGARQYRAYKTEAEIARLHRRKQRRRNKKLEARNNGQ